MAKQKVSGVKYLANGVMDGEPGSGRRVLRNKAGITRVRDMEDAELKAYLNAEQALIRKYTKDHRFTAADIHAINKLFLGDIYDWAGKTRSVNLSKGDFPFASVLAISHMMHDLEENILNVHTPCKPGKPEDVAFAIAIVHVELLLIHPHREGNGRTARLLATLMAYQAGLPGLDFGFIGSRGKAFKAYVAAIQAGLDKNYERMRAIVLKAIKRALRRHA